MSASSCRKIDDFVSNYYKRQKSKYYNENSKIIWNGVAMNALQFLELPTPGIFEIMIIEVKLSSFDVQDVGANILISVSGTAITSEKHVFTQVFMVTFDRQDQIIILVDIFRFV